MPLFHTEQTDRLEEKCLGVTGSHFTGADASELSALAAISTLCRISGPSDQGKDRDGIACSRGRKHGQIPSRFALFSAGGAGVKISHTINMGIGCVQPCPNANRGNG